MGSSEDTQAAGDRLLKPDEVGERLGITGESVRRMIDHAGLRAVNISVGSGVRPRWRIRQADLDAWLDERTVVRAGESA